jgi:hypothetical protein
VANTTPFRPAASIKIGRRCDSLLEGSMGPFMLVIFVFFGMDSNPQFTQRTEFFQSREACKLAGMYATGELKYRLLGKETKPYEVWYHCSESGAESVPVS